MYWYRKGEKQTMEIRYYKEYSRFLNQDMEYKSYGTTGVPVLYIPCQDGRFYDFENFGMLDHLCGWIECGAIRVFAVDTVDVQSLSAGWKPEWERAVRQEAYFHYITEELAMRIFQICGEQGAPVSDGLMAVGFSLGAYHAANFYFRRPDLFTRAICCSGIYSLRELFGAYSDENVYNNSPIDFLRGMPAEHPYIRKYNETRLAVCCGQGAWEHPMLENTRELEAILREKKIYEWIDIWGMDVSHDWYWWKKQIDHILPNIL